MKKNFLIWLFCSFVAIIVIGIVLGLLLSEKDLEGKDFIFLLIWSMVFSPIIAFAGVRFMKVYRQSKIKIDK